jgi:uncharacterized protein (TIGR00661 family)
MKIMFTVQGDGRGHMTQAMAADQILESQGHEVVAVTVGTNPCRKIPDFFIRKFGDRLRPIASPGFSFQGGKGVTTMGTLGQAIAGLSRYRESLSVIQATLDRTQPNLIINFLEPLMGVFNVLRPHPVPVVSIGHQFMLGHPEFVNCRRYLLQQWTMRRYVRLTGARSTKLALSFYQASPLPQQRLFVCPPLLRANLFELPWDVRGRFLLAYVLNQGYTDEIVRWHAKYPTVELHCFCERPKVEPVWRYDSTLWFHKLDGTKFLRMMAESGGVACTAGFESLNEAAWLGKPLLVVPVANHVEQYLNAMDAEKAGLAVAATSFDLTPLLTHPVRAGCGSYREWVRQASSVLLSVIEEVTRRPTRKFVPAYAATVSPGPVFAALEARVQPEASFPGKSGGTPAPVASSREVASRC